MQGALRVGHLLQLARGAGRPRGARQDADDDADNDDNGRSRGARQDADNDDHGRTRGVHQDADNDNDRCSQGARQDARAARAHLHGQPDHQEDSRLSQKRTSQVSGLANYENMRMAWWVFDVDCQVCPHHVHGPKTCVRERSSLHRCLVGENITIFIIIIIMGCETISLFVNCRRMA